MTIYEQLLRLPNGNTLGSLDPFFVYNASLSQGQITVTLPTTLDQIGTLNLKVKARIGGSTSPFDRFIYFRIKLIQSPTNLALPPNAVDNTVTCT
jgi:hypothetical protein